MNPALELNNHFPYEIVQKIMLFTKHPIITYQDQCSNITMQALQITLRTKPTNLSRPFKNIGQWYCFWANNLPLVQFTHYIRSC